MKTTIFFYGLDLIGLANLRKPGSETMLTINPTEEAEPIHENGVSGTISVVTNKTGNEALCCDILSALHNAIMKKTEGLKFNAIISEATIQQAAELSKIPWFAAKKIDQDELVSGFTGEMSTRNFDEKYLKETETFFEIIKSTICPIYQGK